MHFDQFEAMLAGKGLSRERDNGDHRIYTCQKTRAQLIVAYHGKQLSNSDLFRLAEKLRHVELQRLRFYARQVGFNGPVGVPMDDGSYLAFENGANALNGYRQLTKQERDAMLAALPKEVIAQARTGYAAFRVHDKRKGRNAVTTTPYTPSPVAVATALNGGSAKTGSNGGNASSNNSSARTVPPGKTLQRCPGCRQDRIYPDEFKLGTRMHRECRICFAQSISDGWAKRKKDQTRPPISAAPTPASTTTGRVMSPTTPPSATPPSATPPSATPPSTTQPAMMPGSGGWQRMPATPASSALPTATPPSTSPTPPQPVAAAPVAPTATPTVLRAAAVTVAETITATLPTPAMTPVEAPPASVAPRTHTAPRPLEQITLSDFLDVAVDQPMATWVGQGLTVVLRTTGGSSEVRILTTDGTGPAFGVPVEGVPWVVHTLHRLALAERGEMAKKALDLASLTGVMFY